MMVIAELRLDRRTFGSWDQRASLCAIPLYPLALLNTRLISSKKLKIEHRTSDSGEILMSKGAGRRGGETVEKDAHGKSTSYNMNISKSLCIVLVLIYRIC